MTIIKIKDTEFSSLKWITVNNRNIEIANRIESIEQVSAGKWEGIACGEKFIITGGRAAGGARNDWFLYFELGYGDRYIPVSSAAKAVKLIENV